MPAAAGECSGDPADCARTEFEAGISAYQAKEFESAAKHFEAAHALRPHPVVLFNWALAESKLGRFVVALEHFDHVLGDVETPKDLVPEVQRERAEAERNVANIDIEAGADAQVWVDDRPVEAKPPSVRVDPGEHRVRVEEHGRTVFDKTLRAAPGQRLFVAVEHSREPTKKPPPKLPPPPPPPPPPAGPSPIWFYAGVGLTAVLGGVTVWSALDTQKAFDDYERDLPKLKQAEVDARVEDGHDLERRTNLLLGATAIAAAGTAAIGLFVVDWKQGSSPRAGLVLTPGGLAAVGRF